MDAKFLRQLGSMGEPHMASATVDIDKLTPLADMVLVRRLPDEETTAGGLILPHSGRDKREGLRVGVVLRVGKGDKVRMKIGEWRREYHPGKPFPDAFVQCSGEEDMVEFNIPLQVKPGDRVVYARCPDNDVRINGEDLVLLREEQHVLAVLE